MYHSKDQIQNIEQRSIAVFNPNEGPQSLPFNLDRSYAEKTDSERRKVLTVKSNFKRNGLYEWNERNRPGNNKAA